MTDEQIIKALECCKGQPLCDECPLCIDGQFCGDYDLKQNTLNLINRQKAENDKLTKIEHFATKTIEKQQAEIERLESDLTLKTYDYEHLLMKCKELQAISSSRKDRLMQTVVKLQTAKSEAIKEFAEQVQEEIADALHCNYKARGEKAQEIPIYTESEFLSYCSGKIDCLRGLADFIDNLVKEMEGE